ncbi:hypothetical protein ASPSYDRAFT_886250 [Aspergillus sydowii CBS 593.65]|uniref:Uncharacterized protein n=1 Tax=Aspergillus sydowii CBS 593.65 TaxID=1036612 RepID=A0A1L9TJT4_9EURO|nr:uncharacterized protein ASPSYDRAFT_886250 [Aspergillus sydowii CBS 593.65]OJJ59641.1 hypothetical protein ASPSYDRAFT_886250 [Aspergillus sydowii CBS 593.65]
MQRENARQRDWAEEGRGWRGEERREEERGGVRSAILQAPFVYHSNHLTGPSDLPLFLWPCFCAKPEAQVIFLNICIFFIFLSFYFIFGIARIVYYDFLFLNYILCRLSPA